MAIWRIFRRSPLSEEKYPNRNPAWKQALLIIDFQGNTRKGSSTSLSGGNYGVGFIDVGEYRYSYWYGGIAVSNPKLNSPRNIGSFSLSGSMGAILLKDGISSFQGTSEFLEAGSGLFGFSTFGTIENNRITNQGAIIGVGLNIGASGGIIETHIGNGIKIEGSVFDPVTNPGIRLHGTPKF